MPASRDPFQNPVTAYGQTHFSHRSPQAHSRTSTGNIQLQQADRKSHNLTLILRCLMTTIFCARSSISYIQAPLTLAPPADQECSLWSSTRVADGPVLHKCYEAPFLLR